jgi:hypothetical protein
MEMVSASQLYACNSSERDEVLSKFRIRPLACSQQSHVGPPIKFGSAPIAPKTKDSRAHQHNSDDD